MENEDRPKITIDGLAAMIKSEFDAMRGEMRDGFIELRGEMAAGFGAFDKRFTVMEQRFERLDAKLDQHRQETKDGFDAMRRIVGGMSRTLADHEERIKALDGE
jgi:hypothetical protein